MAFFRRPMLARRPLAEFVHEETTGGALLLTATVVALILANVAPVAYDDFWSSKIGWSSPLHLDLTLRSWVNDALMTVFFFVVGLEIKRELVVGELATPRAAALPTIAAAGGMALPAGIYALVNSGGPGAQGWAIPMATDIAFVLGALSLLGNRAPAGLRLFLLAVAIVDDIGAILVIAVFYGEGLSLAPLLAALVVVGAVIVMRRRVSAPAAYIPFAVALWLLVHESGIHATIAGVALGLLTPARQVGGCDVLVRLQHRLHPVSALVVVPLFALANAGVVVDGDAVRSVVQSRIGWGIALGLIVGKTIGISVAALLAQKLRLATLPPGTDLSDLLGGAALAGIGFTVALFIAELSFAGTSLLGEAKLAILATSLVAAVTGSWLIARTKNSD